MRVEFSSIITFLHVDLSEVTNTSDLDVVLGLDEMHALQSSIRNNTGSVTALRAPCNFLSFCLSDRTVRVGGCPQAEIVSIVHPHGLADGRLRRGSTTRVGAILTLFGGLGQLVIPLTD